MYHGDCMEILPTLGNVDAVVTDPPYGMNYNTDSSRFKDRRGGNKANWGGIRGDDKPFDPTPWVEYNESIIWGSNHFGQKLPVGTTLVWIKRLPHAFGTFLSDAEIAWMKGGHGVYCINGPYPQSIAADREHPAQKPLALMEWSVGKCKKAKSILDPFMGAGTTGVACVNLGRKFIGIEIERNYFEVACERIEAAYSQPRLFDDVEDACEQESFPIG